MPKKTEFPFKNARRITTKEVVAAEKAVKEQFGIEASRRGRPRKEDDEKYQAISIKLHPSVLKWAKAEAKRKKIGYQTIINEVLLKQIH
jgi:uncharacterized protein (DUF4415 family)